MQSPRRVGFGVDDDDAILPEKKVKVRSVHSLVKVSVLQHLCSVA